jgi:hypothetical protein
VYTIPPNGYFPTTSIVDRRPVAENEPDAPEQQLRYGELQIITLNASRVLSLAAADLVEKDWNGGHTEQAIHDAT